MKRVAGLPVAVVVAGPGWAARNETAALAMDFEGRLYSERSLAELTAEILVGVLKLKENCNDHDVRSKTRSSCKGYAGVRRARISERGYSASFRKNEAKEGPIR